MIFNSYEFILAFVPATFAVYFLLGRSRLALAWLLTASLFFYAWWKLEYLPLILGSIVVNYLVGTRLIHLARQSAVPRERTRWLVGGVLFNVGLLGYFKYADFVVENVNAAFSTSLPLPDVVLPLAISFFTFQQIAFLADCRQGEIAPLAPVRYGTFVAFFPQLIAGPIVHHAEMMPQFGDPERRHARARNVARGIYVFSIGVFKKVIVADTFAPFANRGFDALSTLTPTEAWLTSLSYTFQLYFDFSGYTDMAIGAALLFNIELPINFESPYRSLDIQDFWRRWHVTLSRFLRAYVYVPLGGNRRGQLLTYRNLVLTFLIGGIWHGAGWTFVAWGLLHGLAVAGHRAFRQVFPRGRLPAPLAWLTTFLFVNIAWVFFRATSWADALKVLRGMAGLTEAGKRVRLGHDVAFLSPFDIHPHTWLGKEGKDLVCAALCTFGLLAVLVPYNSNRAARDFRPSLGNALVAALFLLAGLVGMQSGTSDFLYFDF